MKPSVRPRRSTRVAAAVVAVGLALAGCDGGSSSASSDSGASDTEPASASSPRASAESVLPVQSNPIQNSSTAKTLKIDSVLVENNVGPDGKDAEDHLEVALSNTGSTPLTGLEFFYTFTDAVEDASESYYAEVPDASIPAGGELVVHFDDTGEPGHIPVNEFSLYFTTANALDVEVQASAEGAAVATGTVKKDPPGEEEAD
jgi:hypothetical protein